MSEIETIPPITDPMGKNWDQPAVDEIDLSEGVARMSKSTFDNLAEYSATNPSGVYPGKMWKRHDGLFDPKCNPSERQWLLCWYDISSRGPEWCSNHWRKIVLTDGDLPNA